MNEYKTKAIAMLSEFEESPSKASITDLIEYTTTKKEIMKYLLMLLLMASAACSPDKKENVKNEETKVKTNAMDDSHFIEYYPNSEQIKIEGLQDEKGRRYGQCNYIILKMVRKVISPFTKME